MQGLSSPCIDSQEPDSRLRLAYRLLPDDYRGGNAIQLIVEHRGPAQERG